MQACCSAIALGCASAVRAGLACIQTVTDHTSACGPHTIGKYILVIILQSGHLMP